MKKCVLLLLVTSAFLTSCEKDEKGSDRESITDPAAYYPMTIGSYWVYENYEIDTNGVETKQSRIDSVYVSGDTVINGKTYMELESPTYSPLSGFLRDSSGYLLSQEGLIVFASNDFSNPLETFELITGNGDTIYTGKRSMEKTMVEVTVGAGTFKTLRIRQEYLINSKHVARPHRTLFNYRAPNVGLVVYQTGPVMVPTTLESRLVRYHIEK